MTHTYYYEKGTVVHNWLDYKFRAKELIEHVIIFHYSVFIENWKSLIFYLLLYPIVGLMYWYCLFIMILEIVLGLLFLPFKYVPIVRYLFIGIERMLGWLRMSISLFTLCDHIT